MPPPPARRHTKRRWTRQQLLDQLKLIGDLDAPLPPTLPPSPPASRASSPAPGLKRKLEPSSDLDAVKRPRINLAQDRSQSSRHPPQQQQQLYPPPPQQPSHSMPPPPPTSRSEPCEDGEVREEPPAPYRPSNTIPDVPIRRPRKGKILLQDWTDLHNKYHAAGRRLKYSGDARFWSTYPSSNRDYKPLADPPPHGSPYHKHGGLIARLELLDALLCFTYSIWTKEYPRRACSDTWDTIAAFLTWCKQKWSAEEASNDDAEKAMLGLIYMIEGFVQARKANFILKYTMESETTQLCESISKKIATAAECDPTSATFGINGKAPPMLPSPSSTNSTPVNRDDGTPNSTASAKRPAPPAPNAANRPYTGTVPVRMLPPAWRENPTSIPPPILASMEAVREPISAQQVSNMKDMTAGYHASGRALATARQHLNLPIMRKCFPKTWARMMFTTLAPTDEHEPDFEDEQGELFWPDLCVNGEGIGWVCLMGKAMVQEFGAAYGYKGLDGVVPKPKPEEGNVNGMRAQQQQQRPPQQGYHGGPGGSQPPPPSGHMQPPPTSVHSIPQYGPPATAGPPR